VPRHGSFDIVSVVAVLVLVLVGSLITIRRPRNAIGWIFCASGLLWAVGGAANGYAGTGWDRRGSRCRGASLWLRPRLERSTRPIGR
jgi:hypothetical protein